MAKLLIGIDIGSRFTKIIEQDGKQINGFLFVTPLRKEKDGSTQLDSEVFLKELCRAVDIHRLRNAKIALNLPHTVITVLSVFLPLMSKKELSFAAINEAKLKMIPMAGPNHIFECIFLDEVMVNKIPRAEVLVIRTERIYVQKIINMLESIEVAPALVAPICTALPNILPKEAWRKDESVAIADIGWDSLNISIYKEKNMVFMRNIVYGLKDIMKDFSAQLGIEEAQIEAVIKEQGVPDIAFDAKNKVAIAEEIMRQKYESAAKAAEQEKAAVNLLELRLLWQPHIDRIAQELRRSFVFYREQPEAMRIDQIYFSGGASNIKNLVSILAGLIGGQCSVILPFKDRQQEIPENNPLKNEIISTTAFAGALALSCGIPLPKVAQPLQVNFLPAELKQKEAIAARRLIVLLISTCIFAAFGVFSIHLVLSNYGLRKNTEKIEAKLKNIKQFADRLKELSQIENTVNLHSGQIEELIKKSSDLRPALQDLARLTPPEVLLEQCILTPDKIDIKASVFADYEEANKILAQFKKNLESSGYFKNTDFSDLKLEDILPEIRPETGGQELRLTPAKKRDFSLSAEIVWQD